MKRFMASTLILVAAASCRHQDPTPSELDQQVVSEVATLEQIRDELELRSLPEPFNEMISRHSQSLDRVRQTQDPLLALYRLRDPYVGLHSLAFFADGLDRSGTLEGFEEVWNESSAAPGGTETAGRSILQRALVETGENKARVLREASLAYGRVTSPLNGLYYLSEAVGHRKYAALVRTLDVPPDGPGFVPPAEGSIYRRIREVEQQALAILEDHPEQRTAASISASLKEAGELLDRGLVSGSVLALLEGRMTVASHEALPAGAAENSGVADADDTLAALLTAMGREEQEQRQIFETDLVPFYRALRTAQQAQSAAAAAPVTVTLVRWPYT